MKTVFWNLSLLALCTFSLAYAWPSLLWSQRHLPSISRLSRLSRPTMHRSTVNSSKDDIKEETKHQKDASYIERAPEHYITSERDDQFIERAPLYKRRDLRVHYSIHSPGKPIEAPNSHKSSGVVLVHPSMHSPGRPIGRDTTSLFYQTPRRGKDIYRNGNHVTGRGRTKHKKDEVCQSDGDVKMTPCGSNTSRCIREDQVCNNIQDCDGGEDEDPKSCLLKKWVMKLLPKLEQITKSKKDLWQISR